MPRSSISRPRDLADLLERSSGDCRAAVATHTALDAWDGLGLVVLLIAVVGAFLAFADRYDLAPLAAGHLTTSLERKVTIGSLHVTPGRWLHVELRDFQLDNLPDGTQPVMTTMTSASAEIEAMSLLHGPVVVRGLTVNGLQILLEHTSDDRKNWKFGAAAQTAPPQPSDRSRFPTLLDAQITGDVVFRTSSGNRLLHILDRFQLHTEATDKPVRLDGIGSYNGTPDQARSRSRLARYAPRRRDRRTLPDLRHLGRHHAAIPGDNDKAVGRRWRERPTRAGGADSSAILQIAGASGDFDASLRLVGPFEHDGPLWHLSQAWAR